MNKINNSSRIKKLLKQSLIYCTNGHLLEAKALYHELLKIVPSHPDVLANLGVIELQIGDTHKGINYLEKSIEINPRQPKVISNLGNGFLELKKNAEAINCFDLAIKLNSHLPEAYYNKARALKALTKYSEAIFNYQLALKFNPHYFEAFLNLGFLYNELKDFTKALEHYDSALSLNPQSSEAFYNRGSVYENLGQLEKALADYDFATKINPNNFSAFNSKGLVFNQMRDFSSALYNFDCAIEANPNYFEGYFNKGFVYTELKDFTKALEHYDSALSLNPQSSEAFYNRGSVYENLGQLEKALADYDFATKINPNNFSAFNSKGLVFNQMRDFSSALYNFDCAIEANPNYFEGYFNKAIVLLKLCDYKNGWQFFESRWQSTQKNYHLKTSKKKLDFFNVTQKNIFIWAEQGVGDQIMYATLLKEAITYPNKFIISVDSRIIDLLGRSFKDATNVRFVSSMANIDEPLYDFHFPLGNLGKFFRNSADDFQSQPFSYLISDLQRTYHLKSRLKNEKMLNCGIAWMSKNVKVGKIKSLNLSQLLPILSIPNVNFIDLQYGNTNEEKQSLSDDFGIEVRSLDEVDKFNDINGLASLIDACDFIVTSSNITAHLAGALGKNTYLLVPYSGAGRMWYWHDGLKSSLWYPSIQIFTQTETGDWSVPINAIKEKIVEEISHE
jgi:tetratricopeptide (TPR) repeat protein